MAVLTPPFLWSLLIQLSMVKITVNNQDNSAFQEFQLHTLNQRIHWYKNTPGTPIFLMGFIA